MRFSKLIVKIFFILSIFSFFTFLNYKQVHANSTNKNILDMTFIEKKQFLEDKSMPNIMKHFKLNYLGKCDMKLVNKLANECK